MTDEMLELARANQREAGVENVEFLKGTIEEIPLADESVDVVISNCVINLSADKGEVLARGRAGAAARRPIRRDRRRSPTRTWTRRRARDMQQWTGCIAGALTAGEFEAGSRHAGFVEIEISETHRVHEHAGSAIVRARKPA